MTEVPERPAGGARREGEIPAALSRCPEADWEAWFQHDSEQQTPAQMIEESPYDFARRAFLAGCQAREPASAPGPGELLGYTLVVNGIVAHLGDLEWATAEAPNWRSLNAIVGEVRKFDSGDEIRARRKAADDLTALTGELGLYGDKR